MHECNALHPPPVSMPAHHMQQANSFAAVRVTRQDGNVTFCQICGVGPSLPEDTFLGLLVKVYYRPNFSSFAQLTVSRHWKEFVTLCQWLFRIAEYCSAASAADNMMKHVADWSKVAQCHCTSEVAGHRSPQRRRDRQDSSRHSRDYRDRRGQDRDTRRHRFLATFL